MANTVYKYKFDSETKEYVDDFGKSQVLNPFFKVPTDVPAAKIAQIIECIEAVPRTDTIPCAGGGLFTPRKLIFRRTNGNSFGLVVPDVAKLAEYAKCVRDLFKEDNDKIICIEYYGEKHSNIKERYNTSTAAITSIDRIRPSATDSKNVNYYSGYMKEYATESAKVYGQVQPLSFKSQTRKSDEVLAELATYFTSCVGALEEQFCNSKGSITYRRFNVGFSVTKEAGNPSIQFVNAPAKAHTAAGLTQCATTLAGIQSAACIEYEGESNNRFHLVLPD